MIRRVLVSTIVTVLMTWVVAAQVNSVTNPGGRQRTGANLAETALTTATVDVTTFGKLYSYRLDGPIAGQPIYAAGEAIDGARRNLLYVATVAGTQYVFDVDRSLTRPLRIAPVGSPGRVDPGLATITEGATSWESPADGPLAYAWSENDVLKAYRLNAGRMMTPAYMHGGVLSPRRSGASLALSADGSRTGTGIVWASMPASDVSSHGEPDGILRAFDAETLKEIWTSEQKPERDRIGAVPQTVAPIVADGKVYMPTVDGTIDVYGLLPEAPATSSVSVMSAETAVASASTSALTVAAATAVQPGAIGINFAGSNTTLMAPAENAGVVSKPNWNNATGASRTTALSLVDETGASTTATVTWSAAATWWLTRITDAPGNPRLMKGYLNTGNTSTTTATVSGLPLRAYDVYVYMDGDNRSDLRSADYTISGAGITTATVHVIDPVNTDFGTTFTRASNSNGNYVKFSISATAFTISARPISSVAGTPRAPLNGIQIVPAAPTTTVVSSMGIKFLGSNPATMAAGDRAGIVPQTHWNNAAGAARTTPLPLVDDSGTLRTATVTWTAAGVWLTPIADLAGNPRLMKGYLNNTNTGATTVNVAGLPSGDYDVYVYADGDNKTDTRKAAYQISGTGITSTAVQLTDAPNTNFSGTFVQAAGTTGNYVKFKINGTGFTLTATSGATTSAYARAPVNAIQIVRTSLAPPVSLDPPVTMPGLGAGQGVEVRDGKIYLYGDASTGVIREYTMGGTSSLTYTGRQVLLTSGGRDLISHPTGLTVSSGIGTFLGNTVAQQGTIYMIDWARALAAGTLDGAIQATIVDDLAVNGSRPEFVRVGQRWLIASADYGATANEVRIYDPEKLKTAARTSDPGVLLYHFKSSAYVQTLHWLDAQGLLVLAQNVRDGQGWRLTVIDLARSIAAGQQVVMQTINLSPQDELEGFHIVAPGRGLFLTSSSASNLHFADARLF
jgi:hypothetical protein